MKDSKGALVSHLHQCSHAQLQYHGLLVGGEIADIFQEEEAWPELKNGPIIIILALLKYKPVEVAVGQVSRYEGVLELRIFSVVEPVHTREAL